MVLDNSQVNVRLSAVNRGPDGYKGAKPENAEAEVVSYCYFKDLLCFVLTFKSYS